jgi:hypothetical protein
LLLIAPFVKYSTATVGRDDGAVCAAAVAADVASAIGSESAARTMARKEPRASVVVSMQVFSEG